MDDLPHINVLELYAAKLAITHLAANCQGSHIHLKLDNFTAVSYINRMGEGEGGTHSQTCNHVTQDIWAWSISHNIWLSAAYIPGDTNIVADFHSQCFTESTEWALNTDVILLPPNVFFRPEIDLFASALNHQIPTYISWLPDPNAYAVNAFTASWTDLQFYVFLPFSLIPRVLARIVSDRTTGLLIIPQWTTQSWFPQMLNLLIQHPRRIAPRKDLLHILQQPHMVHPLYQKFSLLAVHLSGRHSLVSAYCLQLQPSSRNHGDLAPECNMIPFSGDEQDFVVQGKSIPCLPLSTTS